jgi:glutamate racemase
VARFSAQIVEKLVREHNVKFVVVACNTAAAAGFRHVNPEMTVPFLSVVEPGLRATIRATVNRRIGVIGTVGTISSGAYQRALADLDPTGSIRLTCAACPGFVEFVERGETNSDQVYVLAERLLAPIRDAKVDALLLGCTHYPFLARTISDAVGREVVLISSADETAFELRSLLSDRGMAKDSGSTGTHIWISSGDIDIFRVLGQQLMGPEIDRVEPWDPTASR